MVSTITRARTTEPRAGAAWPRGRRAPACGRPSGQRRDRAPGRHRAPRSPSAASPTTSMSSSASSTILEALAHQVLIVGDDYADHVPPRQAAAAAHREAAPGRVPSAARRRTGRSLTHADQAVAAGAADSPAAGPAPSSTTSIARASGSRHTCTGARRPGRRALACSSGPPARSGRRTGRSPATGRSSRRRPSSSTASPRPARSRRVGSWPDAGLGREPVVAAVVLAEDAEQAPHLDQRLAPAALDLLQGGGIGVRLSACARPPAACTTTTLRLWETMSWSSRPSAPAPRCLRSVPRARARSPGRSARQPRAGRARPCRPARLRPRAVGRMPRPEVACAPADYVVVPGGVDGEAGQHEGEAGERLATLAVGRHAVGDEHPDQDQLEALRRIAVRVLPRPRCW